jgi:hypothetical protein
MFAGFSHMGKVRRHPNYPDPKTPVSRGALKPARDPRMLAI